MSNLDSSIRAEISEAVAREAANGNTSARGISRALGIDTRTARRHMARLGLVQVKKRGEAALPKPPSLPSTLAAPALRDGSQAQKVLWELLEDPSAPPQSRVAAYNALAEAGAWSNAPQELPEPQTAQEAAERFVLLWESLTPEVQKLVKELLPGLP